MIINGKLKEGEKTTDVARKFDIAYSIVSKLWAPFQKSERELRGRPRSAMAEDDQYVDGVLTAKRNQRRTAGQMAGQFYAVRETLPFRKTVSRHLRKTGL